jgi:AcrR family transcriptional regulator
MEAKKYHHGDLKNALIQAGVEVLAAEGVHGLSLRKVARQAGVSHAAPYAHFADKQALIAAISTEGYKRLYVQMEEVLQAHAADPHRQLIESAWAYVQFAMADADTFKIMFSGVLEHEKDYPEFVEISQKTFQLVVQTVRACQAVGVLRPLAPELAAVMVWGQVHGIISLALMGQISHTVLEQYNLRAMLVMTLDQMTLRPFDGK